MFLHEDLQVDTFDVFHHDVVGVFFVVDIVGSNDVWVIQGSDCFGFALEAFEVGGFPEFGFREYFHSAVVFHDDMFSEVNAAHTAGADMSEEFMFSEEEAFVFALKDFFALPAGQQAGGFEGLTDFNWVF